MKMNFFHYRNYRNNYVRIHKGECRFCNYGNGLQNNILENDNGQWSRGFKTYKETYVDAGEIVLTMHGNNTPIDNGNICNPL